MKTKMIDASYRDVMEKPRPKRKKPRKPMFLLTLLIFILSLWETMSTKFTYRKEGMERLKKGEPYLILMNHTSFLDLQIASRIFFPKRYTIVTTTDAFVGKPLLMRLIGCIPTQKFVTDLHLIKDIQYSLHTLKTPVLMYPEAGYSLDGRKTELPESLGGFVKMMKVPLVTVITDGVYLHNPLYNELQLRKTKTSATVKYLLSVKEIEEKSVEEINAILNEAFGFDAFTEQKEKGIVVDKPFRADGIHRILYRCPACGVEGKTEGKGIHLTCKECGKVWEMTELGEMKPVDEDGECVLIPTWVDVQKKTVLDEIEKGGYCLDCEVDIVMLVDDKAFYRVGEGRLIHNADGFHLTGCDGELDYVQKSSASYNLNVDFFFYEIGDVISIGDKKALYFCFPKDQSTPILKSRFAAQILYAKELEKRRKVNK